MAFSTLSLSIAGVSAVMEAASFHLDDKIGQRSTADFRVIDQAGTSHYKQGQPISITGAGGSVVFSGYVLKSKEKRMSILGGLTHDITATDNVYLGDKRLAAKSYAGSLAGDMVSDLVSSYLAAEGVIGQHLSRVETNKADWDLVDATVGGGTLDPHLDTATAPGDLRLKKQGTDQSKVWTSQADFNAGTFAGSATAVAGGDVELAKGSNVSNVETSQADFNAGTYSNTGGTFSPGDVSLAGFWRNWDDNTTTGQTLTGSGCTMSASGGKFTQTAPTNGSGYSTFNSAPSQSNAGGGFTAEMDFVCPSAGEGGFAYYITGGTVGYHAVYNKGLNTTKIVRADGTTLASVGVTLTAGTTYRLKLVVTSGGVHTFTINGGSSTSATDTTNTSGQVGIWVYNNSGGVTFDNFGCVAAQTGTWTSPAIDISAAKSAASSSASWTATTPTSTTVTVQSRVSTDGGSTWTSYASCTNGSAIPGITVSTDLTNGRVQFLVTLSTTDTTACPLLDDITAAITAGYPLSGTHRWTSQAIDVSGAVVDGGATISWTQTNLAGTTITLETSVDGGSTWQAATSGTAIANLTNGASLSGKTVTVRATISTTLYNVTPQVLDVTITVLSGYYSSGVRVSPGYSLAPLGTARSTTIGWTQTLNGGTLLVETSLDGSTWSTATNGGAIPGINLQGSDGIDGFDVDTSASWTIQGAGDTWTWDTANSRLGVVGSHFSNAIYGQYADVAVTIESSYLDDGGVVLRSNFAGGTWYVCELRDDTGATAAGVPHLYLWKTVSNVWTLLGSADVSWPRGSRHRVTVQIVGTALTVLFDEVTKISVTDSAISGSGDAGVHIADSSGGTNYYDSVIVQSLGTSLSGKTLYVRETLSAPAGLTATPVLSDLTLTLRSSQIEDGPTVTNALFGYARVSDCIDKLAEIADFWWNIDHQKRIYFRHRAALIAPRVVDGTVTVGSVLEEESTVEYEAGNDGYRNREYLTGGTDITVLQTESYKGDGTRQAFALRFQVARVPSSVTVNGVAKTLGIKGLDTGKDWYWSKGDPVLAQDSGGVVLTSSDTLAVQYYGLFDTVYVAQDYGQVTSMQTLEGGGTTGYVEEVDQVAGLDNATALAQAAGGKLTRYAIQAGKLTFSTTVTGFKAGQVVLVYVPWHALNGVQMLIESVKVQDVDGLRVWYAVSAIVGPFDQTWESFWNALARRGSDGIDTVSVGQSGTLLVPVLSSESHGHSESVSVTSYAAYYPSSSLYPSTSIYP